MFPVVRKCGSLTAGFWQCCLVRSRASICHVCQHQIWLSNLLLWRERRLPLQSQQGVAGRHLQTSCSLLLTPPLQSAVRSTEHTLNTHSLPFNGTNLSEIHWGFLFIEEFTIGLLFLTKATFKVDVLRLYPAPFLFLDSVRVALHDKINACLSYSAAPQFILWLPFRPCCFFVFTPNTLEFFVGH